LHPKNEINLLFPVDFATNQIYFEKLSHNHKELKQNFKTLEDSNSIHSDESLYQIESLNRIAIGSFLVQAPADI